VCDFEAQYLCQLGDQTGDGFTLSADVLAINAAPNAPATDQSRLDVDGNGFKQTADVLLANANQPSNRPAKPSGH